VSRAEASFIDIGITAKVNIVNDPFNRLGGAIGVGDTINGMYTYDLAVPDANPFPQVGFYVYTAAPSSITLAVNGLTFRTNPDNVNVLLTLFNDDFMHRFLYRTLLQVILE
jgi:hypothetical protein